MSNSADIMPGLLNPLGLAHNFMKAVDEQLWN